MKKEAVCSSEKSWNSAGLHGVTAKEIILDRIYFEIFTHFIVIEGFYHMGYNAL
jgi:hypothetical protein